MSTLQREYLTFSRCNAIFNADAVRLRNAMKGYRFLSMENRIDFAEEILADSIEGFHRYCLSGAARPDYVSRNLCEMLGCSAEELLVSGDGYAQRVHPEDRERYRAFLASMAQREVRRTLEYRLLRQDGSVLYVQDTMVSRCGEQGMQGFSTLADVTAIRRETEELREISRTVPCGILKYTCEESPRVTYINDQMLHMLRFDDRTSAQLQQYRQNIYLMIPLENRSQFRRFLGKVYADRRPLSGEITAQRYDGSLIRLYGWISKSVNESGKEEFLSVCMDVTDRYDRKQKQEEQSYLRALSQVYDEICEIDPTRHSIRFLQGRYRDKLGDMAHMPMVLEDAARHWVENIVVEEDQARVSDVFRSIARGEGRNADNAPVQMEFRVRRSSGEIGNYIGIFLYRGGNWLFCARNITRQAEVEALRQENDALRSMTDQMRELVMRFTDGMVAFEISGDNVRPMYISDNICRFFGYDQNQWLENMSAYTPIRDFVSRCHISYEDFLELLENREGEFNYSDLSSGSTRRMRAVCTSRDTDGRCYIVLHDVTDGGAAVQEKISDVSIRTFGYFDVFVNGAPIAFRNEKAKELLAILVDRRGGFVTSGEAISLLWEEEEVNAVTLARYRKVALRLKNTLEEHGAASIMESVDGKRRIIPQHVHCDLYEYLAGNRQLFKGSYLQNYSWGESTLAELST